MKEKKGFLILALSASLLMGCTMTTTIEGNSIYVDKEGKISSTLVYTSEIANDSYNQEEFMDYVRTEVADYNETAGAGRESQNQEGMERLPVSLASCELEGQTGKLVFDYRNGADYVGFSAFSQDDSGTVTSLSVVKAGDGTFTEEIRTGRFIKPNGTGADYDTMVKQSDLTVLAIEGAATVQTEGNIAYCSEGIEVINRTTAKVPEGTHYILFK